VAVLREEKTLPRHLEVTSEPDWDRYPTIVAAAGPECALIADEQEVLKEPHQNPLLEQPGVDD